MALFFLILGGALVGLGLLQIVGVVLVFLSWINHWSPAHIPGSRGCSRYPFSRRRSWFGCKAGFLTGCATPYPGLFSGGLESSSSCLGCC